MWGGDIDSRCGVGMEKGSSYTVSVTEDINSCVHLQDMSWMNAWDCRKKNRER